MSKRRADGNDAIVGHHIRAHRLAKRMSQSALAGRIGVTFQQVQKYEKGVNRVGSGRLVRVAAALDVPVMALLAGLSASAKNPVPSPVALIAQAQPLRLVKAFAAIDDKGVRRALMMLTEGIAHLTQRGEPTGPAKQRRRGAISR
jgi:transcriptional regulator with XRE-family HTH domain